MSLERFKLIRTRGRKRSEFVWGTVQVAVSKANASFEETGIPVLVVSHPVAGLVKPIAVVGEIKEPERRPKR